MVMSRYTCKADVSARSVTILPVCHEIYRILIFYFIGTVWKVVRYKTIEFIVTFLVVKDIVEEVFMLW